MKRPAASLRRPSTKETIEVKDATPPRIGDNEDWGWIHLCSLYMSFDFYKDPYYCSMEEIIEFAKRTHGQNVDLGPQWFHETIRYIQTCIFMFDERQPEAIMYYLDRESVTQPRF